MRCDVRSYKTKDIIREVFSPEDFENNGLVGDVCKYVGHCKNSLLDGTSEDISALADRFTLNHVDKACEYVPQVLKRSIDRTYNGALIIDYDDMLWLPHILDLRLDRSDIVMIDEAQDLNPAQHSLVLRAVGNGRCLVIGDPQQSIYGFRGASLDSMNVLSDMLSKTGRGVVNLPLTLTRRCPKSHVAYVRKLLPESVIEALPEAPEGTISELCIREFAATAKPNSLALCRNNAPNVSLAFQLLKAGRKAVILGRDFGEAILTLIDSLKAKSIPELIDKAETRRNKELDRLHKIAQKRGTDPSEYAVNEINDKIDCVVAISENCKNVAEIRAKIEDLFKDIDSSGRPKDAVTFSTIHKAKGLESDDVYIIQPSLMPSSMAKRPDDIAQERNCMFVAYTRSKENMYLVS